jgi:hypothetical protein
MVKYGKLFRELQIPEFKGNYIDYKKLKQKIKEIENLLPRTSQKLVRNRESNISNMKLRPTAFSDEDNDSFLPGDQYGEQLKQFKQILNEEFQRCFQFFKNIKKQLHNKVNRHLYTQTNYISYTLDEIINEVNILRNTTYLAKCLNAFINDNMMAIKKILKKFDKKFSNYFGNIAPRYILENLLKQKSDLEYLLQFKIIDETSAICESNLKLLKECLKEFHFSNEVNQDKKNDFEQKYSQILEYLKDIDQLIYFKIQYKEWFYFARKDAPIISNSNLFKNIMFNPILFSAYHKDDLMNKFLSRKDAIKEVEEIQLPLSSHNKINIFLIFVQTFFYNTLISGIYPLIFEYMKVTNKEISSISYSFFIIASTYFFSYSSIMFYYYLGTKHIKGAFIISYLLFFLGSFMYILSYVGEKSSLSNDEFFENSSKIAFLVISRIIIGIGANSTIGKKYILTYESKYFLPYISKMFVLVSILGHSIGPLIGFFFYDIKDINIISFIYYSKYNFIGWYGLVTSILLLIIHLILFTAPHSSKFSRLKEKSTNKNYGTFASQNNQFLIEDLEDTQDKEFYRLQREMKLKKNSDKDKDKEINIKENVTSSFKEEKKIDSILNTSQEKIQIKDEEIKSEEHDEDFIIKKSGTLPNISGANSIKEYIKQAEDKNDPLLIPYNNVIRDSVRDSIKDETQEEGCFVHINMIPRTIDDLIRKEKKTFGYLNKNLLIIIIILFFDNLLKENFVAYFSYYSIVSDENDVKYNIDAKFLPILISFSYSLELLSMFFILPFHKINTLIKKLLIILMILTILLMIPLSLDLKNFIIYCVIISLVILISSIIEVLSSCYLAYLTPPEWKFSHINAGALPLYVMTFGKICGCLICLSAFSNKVILNHHIIISITILGYGISGIFILKSKNFRIKAIARIMRKLELEQSIV